VLQQFKFMNEQIQQILNVTNQELDQLDTSNVNGHDMHFDISCYHGNSGREHYRLLIYTSTLFNDVTLFDIGTNACRSAVALSFNKNNKLKSYDIIQVMPTNPTLDNVEFILGDSTKDTDITSTPFIFLDVDHDGTYENIFYNFLKETKWKGLLMLDDIHLNEEMKSFWANITEEKYDITSKGHWSGTGLVVFK